MTKMSGKSTITKKLAASGSLKKQTGDVRRQDNFMYLLLKFHFRQR